MIRAVGAAAAIVFTVAACTGGDTGGDPQGVDDAVEPAVDDTFPSIRDVVAEQNADGTWNFDVTVSSPYDTPERYADGWRVIGPDGTVFGVHTLAHDHAAEQPFTRSQNGVEIPDDVDEVTVEGRDLINGFGGTTLTIGLEADTG